MSQIRVRATVNLPRLPLGMIATVDADVPYIRHCIEAGLLAPVTAEEAAEEAQPLTEEEAETGTIEDVELDELEDEVQAEDAKQPEPEVISEP